MTRRLVILRHAKSDWDHAVSDHARPLNARGRRSAPMVGALLSRLGWAPEVAICSDAARTRETWALVADCFPDAEVEYTRALYLADTEAICEVVAGIDPDVGAALILGHNPGLSTTVLHLTGVDCELRTADAALLETRLAWSEAAFDSRQWKLVQLLSSRDLIA